MDDIEKLFKFALLRNADVPIANKFREGVPVDIVMGEKRACVVEKPKQWMPQVSRRKRLLATPQTVDDRQPCDFSLQHHGIHHRDLAKQRSSHGARRGKGRGRSRGTEYRPVKRLIPPHKMIMTSQWVMFLDGGSEPTNGAEIEVIVVEGERQGIPVCGDAVGVRSKMRECRVDCMRKIDIVVGYQRNMGCLHRSQHFCHFVREQKIRLKGQMLRDAAAGSTHGGGLLRVTGICDDYLVTHTTFAEKLQLRRQQ